MASWKQVQPKATLVPRKIVSFDGEKTTFHSNVLEKELKDAGAMHDQLYVISVTGRCRSGKSFLINLMTHYLDYYCQHGTDAGWENDSSAISGIRWAKGVNQTVTQGIWMVLYPKLFYGVRLVFLDYQGTGDNHQSSTRLDEEIMSYSFKLSNLTIVNIQWNFSANDLDAFSVCNMMQKHKSTFKDLIFLVRNYDDDEEPRQLQELVQTTDLAYVRRSGNAILKAYHSCKTVGFPYPGKRLAKASEKDGITLKELDEDFIAACKKAFKTWLVDEVSKSSTTKSGDGFLLNFQLIELGTADTVRTSSEKQMAFVVAEAFEDKEMYSMPEIDQISKAIQESKDKELEESLAIILEAGPRKLKAEQKRKMAEQSSLREELEEKLAELKSEVVRSKTTNGSSEKRRQKISSNSEDERPMSKVKPICLDIGDDKPQDPVSSKETAESKAPVQKQVSATTAATVDEKDKADTSLHSVARNQLPLNSSKASSSSTIPGESDSSEDDDYVPIKTDEVEKILRLCEEYKASDVRVLQNPYDSKKVSVLCHVSAQQDLKDALVKELTGYEVEVTPRASTESTHQLGWQASLTMKRESFSRATCELIVHPKGQQDKLYALGPAHVLFCEEVNLKAITKDCNIERLRKSMNSDRSDKTVWLQLFGSDEKEFETRTGHVFYRYEYPPFVVEPAFSRRFLIDAFLLPLESGGAVDLQKELYSYNFCRKERLKTVDSKDQLQALHDEKVRIAVKNFKGKLYHGARVEEDIRRCKGLKIQFWLQQKEDKLVEGDSGSIVYFIDKDHDGQRVHMPFGMLVQKDPDSEPLPFAIYNAMVLSQFFKDAQEDYPDLADLQLYEVPR